MVVRLMKKICILFVLISIFTVSGCSRNSQDISSNASNKNDILSQDSEYSKSNEDDGNISSLNEVLNSEYDSGVSDVLFSVEKEKYPANVSQITYTITNNRQSEYSFPVYNFSLEKYISGNWEAVRIKEDYVFMTLERVLQPNEKATRTLDLEKIFDLPLEKGIYRLRKGNLKSEHFEIG